MELTEQRLIEILDEKFKALPTKADYNALEAKLLELPTKADHFTLRTMLEDVKEKVNRIDRRTDEDIRAVMRDIETVKLKRV